MVWENKSPAVVMLGQLTDNMEVIYQEHCCKQLSNVFLEGIV